MYETKYIGLSSLQVDINKRSYHYEKIYTSLTLCTMFTWLSGCAYAPHNNLSAEKVSASSIHHTSSLERDTSIEEITNKLPGHVYLKGIAFQDTQKPYYLAINYAARDNQHTFEKAGRLLRPNAYFYITQPFYFLPYKMLTAFTLLLIRLFLRQSLLLEKS
ncbi:hypothetical protein AAAC51_19515 [Priestia megaterium]